MGSYYSVAYLCFFLPLVMLVYQLTKQKYRHWVLLIASYAYFFFWSKKLIVYLLISTFVTYSFGNKIAFLPKGTDRKAWLKKKKQLLTTAIWINLALLLALKYLNFFGTLVRIDMTSVKISVPIGISYYTLQCISYLCDVKAKKYAPAESWDKLALYLAFFPTIMEGPICRYNEVGEDLYKGEPIHMANVKAGYERILWGLLKKVVIADHLYLPVFDIFKDHYTEGFPCLVAAILCTWFLYMDFSGTIDLAIGSGKIFDVTITENFRQPFFAKNASDFWRRWHITLGTFFRDYVFYPVSLSIAGQKLTKNAKKHGWTFWQRYAAPGLGLLCVWLCNGLWHGPYMVYILYGLYYFVLMFIEMILEKPFQRFLHHFGWSENSIGIRIFRFIKLLILVIFGEMLFRAGTVDKAIVMTHSIFHAFKVKEQWTTFGFMGMDSWDFLTTWVFSILVIVVDTLNEMGKPVHAWFEHLPKPVRWTLYYACMLSVMAFGAYGAGYTIAAMIYAGF